MRIITPGRFRPGVFLCVSLIVALMVTGCTLPWRDGTETASVASCIADRESAPSSVTGVFVEPDDGEPPILDELNNARCTIDVTIYMLTNDVIFEALLAAERQGVRVRVILDQYPYGMFGDQQEAHDRLEAGGAEVRWGASQFQFTHAKYIVVDQHIALIMNQNLTRAAFDSNREFGVITTDPEIVDQAQSLFNADWVGEDAESISGPLIVSPKDSRTRIAALVNEAETSIDFYAEVIRDDGILAALRDAVRRDVRVRLVVNQSVDPADLEAISALSLIGVDVRMMQSLYIHSKVMIIDGEFALVGSQNYTMTSLDRNREVGLVVDDPVLVERVVVIFERDWIRSVPGEVSFRWSSSISSLHRYPKVPAPPFWFDWAYTGLDPLTMTA